VVGTKALPVTFSYFSAHSLVEYIFLNLKIIESIEKATKPSDIIYNASKLKVVQQNFIE
jgi:hypothetical protein